MFLVRVHGVVYSKATYLMTKNGMVIAVEMVIALVRQSATAPSIQVS